jgi:hypothetical protein
MLTAIIDLLAGAFKARLKDRLRSGTAEALAEVHAEFAAALAAGDLPAVAGAVPAIADGGDEAPKGRKGKVK